MKNVITLFLAGLYMIITLSECQARPLSVIVQTDLASQRKLSNSGHDDIGKWPRRRRAADLHIRDVGDERHTLTLEGDKRSTPVPVVELRFHVTHTHIRLNSCGSLCRFIVMPVSVLAIFTLCMCILYDMCVANFWKRTDKNYSIVIVVAIFAAVVLVTYRKLLPSEDEKYKIIIYKLVKFYHVLCQKRRLEAQADHKDIESGTDPPYRPVQRNHEKPLQCVAPIKRAKDTNYDRPDTFVDWSTIPYADLSMIPEPEQPHSLEAYLEMINEEQQEQPSTTPLIQTRGNTNSVDSELTAQKTVA